jgi:hypothetical protein
MSKFTLETVKRVYNDTTGDYWEIGPDADALELLEIRACTSSGDIVQRITFPPEALDLLIQALESFKYI